MRGRVEVKSKESWSGEVSVSVGGELASVNVPTATARKKRDFMFKSKCYSLSLW